LFTSLIPWQAVCRRRNSLATSSLPVTGDEPYHKASFSVLKSDFHLSLGNNWTVLCAVVEEFAGLIQDKSSVEDFVVWIESVMERCIREVCHLALIVNWCQTCVQFPG